MYWMYGRKVTQTAIVLSILALAAPPSVLAVTRSVPSQYATIQAAINAASDGDEIVVAPGTYTGPGNRDIELGGRAITVKSANPADPAVIDCQGSDAEHHQGFVLNASGEGSDSIIEGLTITNGYAEWGGAIRSNQTQVTIIRCRFLNNVATAYGGAVCMNNSPTMIDCTFEGNTSPNGGALRIEFSNALVRNCVFTNNSSDLMGGAVSIYQAYPSLMNCKFTANTSMDGGAVRAENMPATGKISNCVFVDNESSYWGGGVSLYRAGPTITGCTLTGNSGGYYGGAVSCKWESTPTLTNCILWANTASTGPEVELRKLSTISVNYCDVQGGAGQVYVDADSSLDWGTGNKNADPDFADEDCHLAAGSPCINAGDPGGDYSGETDIDGQDRVADGRVEMGADESGGSEPPAERYTLTLGVNHPESGTATASPAQPPDGYPEGTVVTLTATPTADREFIAWMIYDPDHPGDTDYIQDPNDPNLQNEVLVLVMDRHWEVDAGFNSSCGSAMDPLVPMLLPVAFGLWFVANCKGR
jgi:hypothetical protein